MKPPYIVSVMSHLNYSLQTLLAAVVLLFTSCGSEWSDHYDLSAIESTEQVEVYHGTAAQWLQQDASLSRIQSLLSQTGYLDAAADAQASVTLIVTPNSAIAGAGEEALADKLYPASCISNFAVAPNQCTSGRGILTLTGKNVWVTRQDDGLLLFNDQPVSRVIKTDNGYVYYVSGVIPVQPSMCDYVKSLGPEYSFFKNLVQEFEDILYRYDSEGQPIWDLWSEAYQSTLLIPNDELLRASYDSALVNVLRWNNRAATPQDSLKFRRWLLTSCFIAERLAPKDIPVADDALVDCVGGYVRSVNEATDQVIYKSFDTPQWKPTVQQVDLNSMVKLSNANAYQLLSLRIPNNVVIHRVKDRFSDIWSAMSASQRGETFEWHNLTSPSIITNLLTAYTITPDLPTIYYNALTAAPTEEAMQTGEPVWLDFHGATYNSTDKTFGVQSVWLPAGEYNLRMGFNNSCYYSVDIYFADEDEEFSAQNLVRSNLSLQEAANSGARLDRGGATSIDYYGNEALGYPEYFDWQEYYNLGNEKAQAYDTDGYQIATVRLKHDGRFKIRIASSQISSLYRRGTQDRTRGDVYQFLVYHWCLRPTRNNY